MRLKLASSEYQTLTLNRGCPRSVRCWQGKGDAEPRAEHSEHKDLVENISSCACATPLSRLGLFSSGWMNAQPNSHPGSWILLSPPGVAPSYYPQGPDTLYSQKMARGHLGDICWILEVCQEFCSAVEQLNTLRNQQEPRQTHTPAFFSLLGWHAAHPSRDH